MIEGRDKLGKKVRLNLSAIQNWYIDLIGEVVMGKYMDR